MTYDPDRSLAAGVDWVLVQPAGGSVCACGRPAPDLECVCALQPILAGGLYTLTLAWYRSIYSHIRPPSRL